MTYTPVLPNLPHQDEARARMRGRRAFALLMGMRTGKTKVILDDWGEMVSEGEAHDLLLFSPAGALYGEDAWETQVGQHLPPEILERTRVGLWRSGGGAAARRALEAVLREADPRRPRVLMMNIEAMSGVAAARQLARDFLQSGRDRGRRAVGVVGESTTIKGTSERTEAVQALAPLMDYRRIESGLVAPHSPLDLYHQFQFLDPAIMNQHSWFGFRARYAILQNACFLPAAKRREYEERRRRLPTSVIVVGYRNEEELRDRIAPHSYRKELRDCQDAPPATYRWRDVEMTPDQARMYRELLRDDTTEVSSGVHVTPGMKMVNVLRRHQLLCGYLVDEGRVLREFPENRTVAVLSILSDYGGKAIVWCAYDHSVRRVIAALRKRFGEESTVGYWGGNLSTRDAEERRFKGEDACRFIVATASAGGRGRKWDGADLAIYHSSTPNLEHRDQSEMRTEALGKFDPVTRIDLRVPGTVDEKIIQNLRKKIDMASTLQGDAYRDWLI